MLGKSFVALHHSLTHRELLIPELVSFEALQGLLDFMHTEGEVLTHEVYAEPAGVVS